MIDISTNFEDYFVMTDKNDDCVEFLNGFLYTRLEGDEEPVKSKMRFSFEEAWQEAKLLLGVD